MSLYILTLDEMKAELGIPDHKDDALLTNWMEGLQGRFDDHLNRTLLRGADVTEYFDGDVTALMVAQYPIENVSSIHVDNDQSWTADAQLASDEFRLSLERGLIFYGTTGKTRWPEGRQNIRAIYTGGYAALAVPEGIKRAFRLQAGFEWRNRLQLGKESVSAQGMSVSLAPAELLRDVRDGLAVYRRM